jgi:outer membrane protein OmpA-like peptidoglycan-associated protein
VGPGQPTPPDAAGRFTFADIQPGTQPLRFEAENYLIKQIQVGVVARETANVEVSLAKRPTQPLVRVQRSQIRIRRQINFATDSDEIVAQSFSLMEEIADTLLRHPELLRVEIQGHTDNVGRDAHNLDLSQRRAESVRRWLVDHGVAPERLTARGFGMTQPLVPNITPANRARNRRVQFMIEERSDEE